MNTNLRTKQHVVHFKNFDVTTTFAVQVIGVLITTRIIIT